MPRRPAAETSPPPLSLLRHAAPFLAVAVASRLLVALAGRFGLHHLRADPTAPPAVAAAPAWLKWDALAYSSIATSGYRDPLETAFFPLYPLIAAITSLALSLSRETALLLVANGCFLCAAVALGTLVRREAGPRAALYAVAGVSLAPPTFFLSAAYPESLFLLLSALTLLCLRAGRPVVAAVLAGLASGTRPVGCVLALAVMYEVARSPAPAIARSTRALVLGAVSVWGLVAYMAYLGVAFGDPVLFVRSQSAWHSRHDIPLSDYLPWQLAAIVASASREAMVNAAAFAVGLVVTLASMRRLPGCYTVVSLAALALLYWRAPYILFAGAARHLLPLVPLYVGIGVTLRRHPAAAIVAIALSAGLSVFWTALFVQGYPIR